MRHSYRRRRGASTGWVALSIFAFWSFSFVRELPLRCSSTMQATGAAGGVVCRTGSATAPRVRYWQVLLREGFWKRRGEKCFVGCIAGCVWPVGTCTCKRSAFQSFIPYCFLTGHVQGFCAFAPGASQSGSGLRVLRSEPGYGVGIYSTHLYPPLGFRRSARTAKEGRATDSTTFAGVPYSIQKTSAGFDSSDGGPKFPTALKEGTDIVELTGEVIPSRVKGPVSPFTVCLLHGLLGSRRNLRTIGSCLASPRIVAWDLRNHGQSPWRETMSIDELARDALHTIHERASFLRPHYPAESSPQCSKAMPSALEFKKTTKEPPLQVVLVGHSLGGLTAMRAATLAANHAISHCCSASRPAVHIAGLVILDMAPIDYTTASEQERLRAHHEKTGTPCTEDIVRLLADLPMHLYEDKKQLEKTLRTATSPCMPPEMVSWLMTGVLQSTTSDFDERLTTGARAAAAGETTTERCRIHKLPKKVGPESRRPGQSKASALRWQINIQAISRMLASKQLGWRFTDCPISNETEQFSPCKRGEARQTEPVPPTGKQPAATATKTAYACPTSSGNQNVAQGTTGIQPAAGCGAYSGPTLFLKGSESPYIDLKRHWDRTLRVFPNAECKVVPGAGHWLHADKPQLTAEYINDFLITI